MCSTAVISYVLWSLMTTSLANERTNLSNWTAGQGDRFPEQWRLLKFPSIDAVTRYQIVSDPTHGKVVWARSEGGAGGLARSLSIDPRHYPILSWNWKIDAILPGSSLVRKNGDDFPARLMISFSSKGATRRGLKDNVLCYVWAAEEPVGSVAVNPVHSHLKTMVVVTGNDLSGTWLEMSRNIVADYQQAFSEEPGVITGVVLMTDSDNTGSNAQAWYGPIWLSRADEIGSQDAAR